MMETRASGRALPLPTGPLQFGLRAEQRVAELLDAEIARWSAVDPALVQPLAALRDLVTAGGKRLRPAFCYWAFVGAGGDPDDPAVVDVGAALELLHAFALVHDDVMDGSATAPRPDAVHARFADDHRAAGLAGRGPPLRRGRGDPRRRLRVRVRRPALAAAPAAARPVFDELRIELCVGQFLDLAATASAAAATEPAERIERYKSGKYTVERPLHLGAALAGRLDDLAGAAQRLRSPARARRSSSATTCSACSATRAVTGKPVGDDLREGKLTPLIASAVARDPALDTVLERIGSHREGPLDDETVAEVQQVAPRRVGRGRRRRRDHRRTGRRFAGGARPGPDLADARARWPRARRLVAWRDR